MFDHDPLNLSAIMALPPIPATTRPIENQEDREVWHLFLVQDGSNIRIMSGESASPSKAEELVTAAAIDEYDFDQQHTGCEYLGIIDRDVDVGVQEA